MSLDRTASQTGQAADPAADQGPQEVRMGRVIPPREAAVRGQLALYALKDFLTNESRNMCHERPLLARGIDAGIRRMLTRDCSRAALQRSTAVTAVAIHLTAIRGV